METLKVSSFFNLRGYLKADIPLSRAFEINKLNPILASQTAKVNILNSKKREISRFNLTLIKIFKFINIRISKNNSK